MAENVKPTDPVSPTEDAEPFTPPPVSVQPSATGVAATAEEAEDPDTAVVNPNRD